jgi:hypothetical protein
MFFVRAYLREIPHQLKGHGQDRDRER